MGVEANTNKTEYVHPLVEHKAGHTHYDKVCNKCKEHKSLSEFSKKRDNKDGLRNYCKPCAKVDRDNMCPFKKWFTSRKGQAKVKGKEFTIEPEDILGVKIEQSISEFTIPSGRNKNIMIKKRFTSWNTIEYPKVCPVLGIELDWNVKINGGQDNSPSLDRIDSTKGYIPGNVMIMSKLANCMKQNATSEQLVKFSKYMLSEHGE
tara:strand:+ start:108 stop:722 length:615 start_codon:yes stop_codon:yes gene_type:complete